jgi:arginase family enzyme
MRALSLADVRPAGPREAAWQALEPIPASARILLHFDIDVLQQQDMPAVYFPHTDGLTLSEGVELLSADLQSPYAPKTGFSHSLGMEPIVSSVRGAVLI